MNIADNQASMKQVVDNLISLLNFLQGYYKIFICGRGAERFLNLCGNKGILLWKLSRKKEGYVFFVSRKAYESLIAVREKTNTTIEIEGKYGLPFFLYRYRKRKLFFAGMAGCGILIYILSLFIWDIQIVGTVRYTKEEIEKYLTEKEIHTGIRKKTINCALLEEEIREDFPDAAWVSCDIEGTRFRVHLKESIDEIETGKKTEEDQEPKDIVASKPGTITSIITRNGTPLVKKGDQVKKGDTLISGVIYLYNEFDELLETSLIKADGDIKAQTVYEYEDSFALSYYDKSYTGAEKNSYQIYFGDYCLPLPAAKNSFESYDQIDENHKLCLGKHIYLPLSLEKTRIREYLPVKKTLKEAEARKKAEKKLAYYIRDLKEKGIEIVDQKVSITLNEEECTAKGRITVIESIGKTRKIKYPAAEEKKTEESR